MSIPWLVHKEDADNYDAFYNEPIFAEYEKRVQEIEGDRSFLNSPEQTELVNKQLNLIGEEFDPRFKALEEKYGTFRVIRAFDPKPKDTENYYVYYRGRRLDKEFGGKMMGVAYDGIEKIKGVLEK